MYIYVIDLETGNYDPDADNFSSENAMICEIGIARLDTRTGEIKRVFNKTCREEAMCHPSSWIFRNTALTFIDVSGADHLSSIRDDLQSILDRGIPSHLVGTRLRHPTPRTPHEELQNPAKFLGPKEDTI